ncbi:hypothetical protein [Desulfofundulus sp.]|uniref:hypothetical protein n=1 Tax=Desulfofundulus sp. TaxID=2282750 RepID=UPI003C77C74E
MKLREKLLRGVALISVVFFAMAGPLGPAAAAATVHHPAKHVAVAVKHRAVPAKPANPKAGVKKATSAVPAAKVKTKTGRKVVRKPVTSKKTARKPVAHKKTTRRVAAQKKTVRKPAVHKKITRKPVTSRKVVYKKKPAVSKRGVAAKTKATAKKKAVAKK